MTTNHQIKKKQKRKVPPQRLTKKTLLLQKKMVTKRTKFQLRYFDFLIDIVISFVKFLSASDIFEKQRKLEQVTALGPN